MCLLSLRCIKTKKANDEALRFLNIVIEDVMGALERAVRPTREGNKTWNPAVSINKTLNELIS